MHIYENDKITIYHGSTSLFETIDITKGKPYKDFGRGFYVTESFSHARSIAVRTKRLEKERSGGKFPAYVYSYALDMDKVKDFKIKEFSVADLDWMRFVLSNRSVHDKSHSYDIIIGPTANDDTSIVLKSYFSGLYGDIDSEKALQLALDMIEADNLPAQIYFGSNDATVCLTMKGTVRKV